jgi:hypothetical protein
MNTQTDFDKLGIVGEANFTVIVEDNEGLETRTCRVWRDFGNEIALAFGTEARAYLDVLLGGLEEEFLEEGFPLQWDEGTHLGCYLIKGWGTHLLDDSREVLITIFDGKNGCQCDDSDEAFEKALEAGQVLFL